MKKSLIITASISTILAFGVVGYMNIPQDNNTQVDNVVSEVVSVPLVVENIDKVQKPETIAIPEVVKIAEPEVVAQSEVAAEPEVDLRQYIGDYCLRIATERGNFLLTSPQFVSAVRVLRNDYPERFDSVEKTEESIDYFAGEYIRLNIPPHNIPVEW
jgi:hypothetical protein